MPETKSRPILAAVAPAATRLGLASALAILAVASVAAKDPQEAPALPDDANKIAQPIAVFSGLDKITGRIISFDVAIDETVQFGALQVTPRVCYSRPQTVAPLTDSFVEVDEITLDNKIRRIFSGWMFADSPGLHAVDHAVYDVWLTDCRSNGAEAAKKAGAAAAPTEPEAAARKPDQTPPAKKSAAPSPTAPVAAPVAAPAATPEFDAPAPTVPAPKKPTARAPLDGGDASPLGAGTLRAGTAARPAPPPGSAVIFQTND